MAGFDENIVREYFELNGFFVRQLRKYAVQSRKKRADEEIDLCCLQSAGTGRRIGPGLSIIFRRRSSHPSGHCGGQGLAYHAIYPATLRSSTKVFDFLKKDVLNKAGDYFNLDGSEVDLSGQGLPRFWCCRACPLPSRIDRRALSCCVSAEWTE